MEDNAIFGPNLKLPSIEGVKSGCENELYLLMKEIDIAFKKKYKDLLKEASELKSLCREKDQGIESLKSVLASRPPVTDREDVEDSAKYLKSEIARLKEENAHLRQENSSLQKKVHLGTENANQLESFKRSLNVQQDENIMLKDRLTTLSKQHTVLQENYQKLLNVITSHQKIASTGDETNLDYASNFMNALIAEETEKYLEEESEHCDYFNSKISEEIEKLKRILREET